jgi:hypothetical protein
LTPQALRLLLKRRELGRLRRVRSAVAPVPVDATDPKCGPMIRCSALRNRAKQRANRSLTRLAAVYRLPSVALFGAFPSFVGLQLVVTFGRFSDGCSRPSSDPIRPRWTRPACLVARGRCLRASSPALVVPPSPSNLSIDLRDGLHEVITTSVLLGHA